MCLLQPYCYIKSEEKTIKEQKKNLEETETPEWGRKKWLIYVNYKCYIQEIRRQFLYPWNEWAGCLQNKDSFKRIIQNF